MEKREYVVGVTIIEARNLAGRESTGAADPFVKITCANQYPQVTGNKVQTNAAVWNQTFVFQSISMSQHELETYELTIEVFDRYPLFPDELIGFQSIGLSTMYRHLNHEFHKTWLTLFNPDRPQDVKGYLLVSMYIVGPNERPPSHEIDEDNENEEEHIDEDALAAMTEDQRQELQKRRAGLFIVQEPNFIKKGFQLQVIVVKAEDLPNCDSSGVNSFISVRSVGCVQITNVVYGNNNPIYGTRMLFPAYMPFLNDKITVRVWSKGSKLISDTFIANLPEFPSQNDFFNISKLLAIDGRLKPTWINLYGILPYDRGWFGKNSTGKKEGSQYLGRVLLAMQLLPNDRPLLQTAISAPVKEPSQFKYYLWVDIYDLVNCDEANGRNLWVSATIGSEKTADSHAKYKPKTESYTWQKPSIKALELNLPQDVRQAPDIIVNVYYTKALGGTTRVAYIRIPARECKKKEARPQWYRLRSPLNDSYCPGLLLMNIQFINSLEQHERLPQPRSFETTYKFFAQILRGFEIAPQLPVEQLKTMVDIKIGGANSKDRIKTEPADGRYPIWNYLKQKEIQLDKDVSFASDMRVMLFNTSKTYILKSTKEHLIGEFSVPIRSITKKYDKPQYFNVINGDGQLQGQVLARFFVLPIDTKHHNNSQKVENQLAMVEKEFAQINDIAFRVNINISIMGIRNLMKNAKYPKLKVKLINDIQLPQEEQFQFKKEKAETADQDKKTKEEDLAKKKKEEEIKKRQFEIQLPAMDT